MAYRWMRMFSVMLAMLTWASGAPDSWLDNFWSTDSAVVSSDDHHTGDQVETIKLASDDLLEQDIMEEVFYNYNTEVRPATVTKPVVFVKHSLSLTSVNLLRNKELTVSGWQDISWYDARLIWDPKDYDNITIISVVNSKIWKPDIVLYYSASELSGIVHDDLKITIEYNGHIHYAPIIHHVTRCTPHGNVFTCKLKYGSWTYNAGQVSVNNTHGHIDLSNFDPESDFKILTSVAMNNEKMYTCCPEKFQDVTYYLTMTWKDSDSFEGLSPIVTHQEGVEVDNSTQTSDVNLDTESPGNVTESNTDNGSDSTTSGISLSTESPVDDDSDGATVTN